MGELIDKVKGKIKQAEGRATGNPAREAEGIADELKGKAKGAFEDVKSEAKRMLRDQKKKDEERRAVDHPPRR